MAIRILLVSSLLACNVFLARADTNSLVLSALLRNPSELELQVSGQPDGMFFLERSADLVSWETVGLFTIATRQLARRDAVQMFYRGSLATADTIAERYCYRAGVVNQTARQSVHDFVNGLADLHLLTNLVDFAFFAQGQNLPEGDPVSLVNTGRIVGNLNRLRGGFEFPNYQANNSLYFTNLPATYEGRSLLVWGAPNAAPNISNNNHSTIFELATSTGGASDIQGSLLFTLNAEAQTMFAQSGTMFLSDYRLYPPIKGENSFFCGAVASGPTGYKTWVRRDYPVAHYEYSGDVGIRSSPFVLRFASQAWPKPNDVCNWNGLIRGFAFFNRQLSTGEMGAVNCLVPRVGVIIEGDSKSTSTAAYPGWDVSWLQSRDTWGLYSIITNSAVGGTVVSSKNSGGSMEERWPANSLIKTNQQYPIILYSLRGGHNDLFEFGANMSSTSNAFHALTNLWSLARSNGFKTIAWTIDRTRTSYGINSNLLEVLNGWIKAEPAAYDYLVDPESFFVNNYGPVPYTNTLIYTDGVHESQYGKLLVGSNVVGRAVSPSLGFEVGEQAN